MTADDIRRIVRDELASGRAGVGCCSATNPHTGRLRYAGNGRYYCECGMHYVKDGRGGLRAAEAPKEVALGA